MCIIAGDKNADKNRSYLFFKISHRETSMQSEEFLFTLEPVPHRGCKSVTSKFFVSLMMTAVEIVTLKNATVYKT